MAHALHLPLLIDEKLGRNAAKKLNIKIIGTLGVLLLAKRKKVIRTVKPIMSCLKRGRYFISDKLIKETLLRAKEK